jgi:hypothetical protein
MDEANQKWDDELDTLDTLPNAFSQLIYIMFVMMPTKEKEVGGQMEYQDYLMDQVSNQLVPRLDDIKNDFNEIINAGPTAPIFDGSDSGDDAIAQANNILLLVYTNPNLSSNSQLTSNVESAISSLFCCEYYGNGSLETYQITMTQVPVDVTINGQAQTVEVPQLEGEYCEGNYVGKDNATWKSCDAGEILAGYWSGASLYYDGGYGHGEGLSEYESQQQQWTADLNELSTTFTDFSKTATSVFQFYMGEEKQLLSILDNCLQDLSKGEQQAINNEITS